MRSALRGSESVIFPRLPASLCESSRHPVPGKRECQAFLWGTSERAGHMGWIPVGWDSLCAEDRFLAHREHQLAQRRECGRDDPALDTTDCGLCRSGAQRESTLAQAKPCACGSNKFRRTVDVINDIKIAWIHGCGHRAAGVCFVGRATLGSMRFMPTCLVAAASLIAGFAVAVGTGSRPLGGLVLATGGLWCLWTWRRRHGARTAVILGCVGFGAFVLSHVLGLVIGAWPSVLLVAAGVAGVVWTRADAHLFSAGSVGDQDTALSA